MKLPPAQNRRNGRPPLDSLEKQRRLVARLCESCAELERQLVEDSGHEQADESQRQLLHSTFKQRLTFARGIAKFEKDGLADEAKWIRQKLNLFRPLGFTEEAWNALPESAKRLPPGKPKLPRELELARIEIECDEEVRKLRELEDAAEVEPANLSQLQDEHGKIKVGRPKNDILGALDRQMQAAIYKRRDLIQRRTREVSGHDYKPSPLGGRPRKAFDERYEYFTRIIDHCQQQIQTGESKLSLIDLQRRLLKRLRDKAARNRLHQRSGPVTDAIRMKLQLPEIENQIVHESERLKNLETDFENMTAAELEDQRKLVAQAIRKLDSIERFEEYEDRLRLADESSIF